MNLKRIREEKQLSQSELAKKSEVSVRMIQNYEQGANPINGSKAITIYKLATGLGCAMEDLIEKEE